jgi:cytochrome c556
MKKKKILGAMMITLLVMSWFVSPAMGRDVLIKEPPKSLSKFYPPESKKPEWIGIMHKMSGHFGGVFMNMGQKDWANADKHVNGLAEAYEKASKMVPEWEEYFDLKAAKAFVEAVKSRDPKAIGKASGPLGKTCGSCHDDNIAAVWTKFHWPSVEHMKIEDPIDEKEIEYPDYMGLLSKSFKGVTVNFGDGKKDLALKGAKVFKKRYMELKTTCSKCHTTDIVKQFFVGEPVAKAFDDMTKELANEKPNPGIVWKNVGIIGKLGCKKCHLTHRAYSIFQEVWEKPEKEMAKK